MENHNISSKYDFCYASHAEANAVSLAAKNGISLNDVKVTDVDAVLSVEDFTDGAALVKKGKKKYYRLCKA